MEEVDPDALADIAYGLFEVFLNKEIRRRGPYLFELVEQEKDFLNDFEEIFTQFKQDYPLLADALLHRFGDTAAIYAMLQRGEGVIPSQTTQMYWIVQDAPDVEPEEVSDEKAGKWLLFLESDKVDEAWKKIRDETCRGSLGISAKVSTAKPNPESRDERKVIYIYTRNWEDEADVMRVRERLRELGFTDRIGYKRNIETYRGEYSRRGKRVTYYSA
ncbi:MAG TPA: putative phosphothreonine lyase domain-containing protein [Methanomicrobiales archaeon]|nr:putative phosphothreonine lyase domain-containing protein [Methanomicrobiales archaeon]